MGTVAGEGIVVVDVVGSVEEEEKEEADVQFSSLYHESAVRLTEIRKGVQVVRKKHSDYLAICPD